MKVKKVTVAQMKRWCKVEGNSKEKLAFILGISTQALRHWELKNKVPNKVPIRQLGVVRRVLDGKLDARVVHL